MTVYVWLVRDWSYFRENEWVTVMSSSFIVEFKIDYSHSFLVEATAAHKRLWSWISAKKKKRLASSISDTFHMNWLLVTEWHTSLLLSVKILISFETQHENSSVREFFKKLNNDTFTVTPDWANDYENWTREGKHMKVLSISECLFLFLSHSTHFLIPSLFSSLIFITFFTFLLVFLLFLPWYLLWSFLFSLLHFLTPFFWSLSSHSLSNFSSSFELYFEKGGRTKSNDDYYNWGMYFWMENLGHLH